MEPTNNPIQNNNPIMPEAVGPIGPEPVNPVVMPADQAAPTMPVNPAMPEAVGPAPVNPVINPAVPVMPTAPVAPVTSAAPVAPVNPVINPVANPATMVTPGLGDANTAFGATDPITMPTPPKAPDPIEEELKAPLKAAEPVPGSIGSAISVPAEGNGTIGLGGGRTPSVAFNDPAMAAGQPTTKPAKKTADKKTLIILAAIAGVVVIALATVLIMQLV